MKLTTTTILFFTFSGLQIARTLRQVKHEKIGIRSGIIWIILWASIGVGSLFPSIMDIFMRLAMMENRMFFILIIAVFILYATVFNLVSKIEKAERNVAKLVQEIALLRYQLEEKAKPR